MADHASLYVDPYEAYRKWVENLRTLVPQSDEEIRAAEAERAYRKKLEDAGFKVEAR